MTVEPNRIYAVPPGRVVTLERGVLRFARDGRGKRAALELFLRSLAEDQGPCAEAILARGVSPEVAQGFEAVAAAGGMSLATPEAVSGMTGVVRSGAGPAAPWQLWHSLRIQAGCGTAGGAPGKARSAGAGRSAAKVFSQKRLLSGCVTSTWHCVQFA